MICDNIMSWIVTLHNAIRRTNFLYYAVGFSRCSLSSGAVTMPRNFLEPHNADEMSGGLYDLIQDVHIYWLGSWLGRIHEVGIG